MVMIVEPQYIEAVWPKVWPTIEPAVFLDNEKELLEALKAGNQLLLVSGDCAAVCYPDSDIFWINYVGGKNIKEHWPDLSAAIDDLAKRTGSKFTAALARPAWKKIATDYEATEQRVYIKRHTWAA